MSAPNYEVSHNYGTRLLPQALDELASSTPHRLYASIPRERDLSHGFLDVTCEDMARCVNFMASWITSRLEPSQDFETLAYIGIPDLRSAAIFLGAVKAGFKVLLPSPRNPSATNLSLLGQTGCTKILYAAEVTPIVKQLNAINESLTILEVPSFQDMFQSTPSSYPFGKIYDQVKNDPILILHSSGSTGLPKPITMTHATFAVLDNERNLPKVPGRRNRDYSIWDFNDGGRFYTVFPYFHLAGFLSLLVNPIFTEASSPVLGPPLMPPSGSLLKDVMRHQELRALYLPPSIAEQFLLEPGGIDFFKDLDFLCYTGGPFSPSAGEQLSMVTELCPLYGSTEAFQVPQLAPSSEDWAWMEWNPYFKVEMQPSEDEHGAFELVLYADSSTEKISALNHNMPGTPIYRTKDLFKQHPEKPQLWQYYGRRDDIIVLSNGEKFNPVPAELLVQGHSALAGALVIGQGRTHATLLVEPKPDLGTLEREGLVDSIWPLVEKSNYLLPGQGRILRASILAAHPAKPFVRAGKGTIVRKLTEKLYLSEIEALYANKPSAPIRKLPTLKPVFESMAIQGFIQDIIATSFPDFGIVEPQEDLFSRGLDSVMITELLSTLKVGLQESSTVGDLSWLDARVVYQNSSIEGLSRILYDFLNDDKMPTLDSENSRSIRMEELVQRYTEGLMEASIRKPKSIGPHSVALIGSTGYLGPRIAASLLSNPKISSLYCLNRGSDAKDRTIKVMQTLDVYPQDAFEKAIFLSVDLGSSRLGMSDTEYQELASEVDIIIYNSWKPDFSTPLQSFEKPFLTGLRSVIDWSYESPKAPRILFISSIAAVGSWSKVYPDQPVIPEVPIQDCNVAMGMGYGESKCVAERILGVANQVAGIPVSILRVGQIGGPLGLGKWPVQKWLLAIIKTSKTIKALPDHVSPVDRIPVDALSDVISDIASAGAVSNMFQIFNLTHPDPAPWKTFLQTLINRYGLKVEIVSLPEWLDKLDGVVKLDGKDRAKLPALALYNFFRSLGEGLEDMRSDVRNMKSVLRRGMDSFTEELLMGWLQDWDLEDFLEGII
ncbi:putative NRPS-like enzyme [Lindgomyces ingoldianus]|uniref:NRPS-like enzyme n=1 Tax=Lindgomyces ingoldianus TaxID=673940 RepID=A0ACB6R1C7_9PLEO|nr:putative NRPS-like enzyme [Lindgomyces ingoldianus]KAF2472981.1 putative NRPS-like enzyme [Lindgomyces ingoldianus]